jgi:hypothetical protein
MKVVNRDQFMAMPAGTLYQKYRPMIADDLEIKGDNCGETDFFLQNVCGVMALKCNASDQLMERFDEMVKDGASYPVDLDSQGRDGCFDADQLFLVWERADVEALIARLRETLA